MIICFGIAAISFSGVMLKDDMTGRMLFGIVWASLGVIWFGEYIASGSRRTPAPRSDGA